MKISIIPILLASALLAAPITIMGKRGAIACVKTHTFITEYPQLRFDMFNYRNFHEQVEGGKGQRRLLYFSNEAFTEGSLERIKSYETNYNIMVRPYRCNLGEMSPDAKPYVSFICDSNKIIDVYISRPSRFCDLRSYWTNHPKPFAILIDENGYILSIQHNVRSEKEILKGFGII